MSEVKFSKQVSADAEAISALAQLCKPELDTASATRCEVSFSDIFSAITAVCGPNSSALTASIKAVLLRVLEMSILRDETILLIAQRWEMLGPKAPELIRARLQHLLGVDPPEMFRSYLTSIISGSAMQRGRRVTDYNLYLPQLFRKVAESSVNRELRCGTCGYHFKSSDLKAERRNLAISENLQFAPQYRSERNNNRDPWKPLYTENAENRRFSLTGLTIDHVVPEEGLGWSDADNLEIACRLCNAGKMAYRWALEPLSLFAAGGLADYPQERDFNRLKQSIVVAAYRFHDRRCSLCGATANGKELTVRPEKRQRDTVTKSLAPWNLRTLCYDCLGGPSKGAWR